MCRWKHVFFFCTHGCFWLISHFYLKHTSVDLQHNFLLDVIFQRRAYSKWEANGTAGSTHWWLYVVWSREQRKVIRICSSRHCGRCGMKGQSRFSLRYGVLGFVQKGIKITTLFMWFFTMSMATESMALFTPADLFLWCHLNTNLLHFKYAMIPSYLADRWNPIQKGPGWTQMNA